MRGLMNKSRDRDTIKPSGSRNNFVQRLRLPIMVALLTAAVLLLGSHIGLARGRLSRTLERSTGVDFASRNGTQLSGDVSSCPGSSLGALVCLLNAVSAGLFDRVLLDVIAKH